MTRRLLLAATALTSLAAPTFAGDCPKAKPAKVATKAGHAATNDIVQTAAAAGSFRTLVTCLVAADLVEALKGDGPFVVFAPTDEAFAKLPNGTVEALLKPENKEKLKAILTYHVLPNKGRINYDAADDGTDYSLATLNGAKVVVSKKGSEFRVNGSNIPTRNLACRNGSIQVIDSVLLPPEPKAVAAGGKTTIPSVATEAGTFKTLLAAVAAADLAETLAGPGPFTVFAPTDEAFAKLPKGTVEALLKPENKRQLVALFKYHVVAGSVFARDAVAAGTARTLAGGTVRAGIRDGRLLINESAVVKSDIAAGNGVIHAIDTVLTPSH
jgi:uncharacterized surface protein with fasciclin (FAS1) repeats